MNSKSMGFKSALCGFEKRKIVALKDQRLSASVIPEIKQSAEGI